MLENTGKWPVSCLVFLTPPYSMKKTLYCLYSFFSNVFQPVTDRNGVNEQTHTYTSHTERWNCKLLVGMKKRCPYFFKTTTPILPTPSFLWKKSSARFFWENFERSGLPPFIKERDSNYRPTFTINQFLATGLSLLFCTLFYTPETSGMEWFKHAYSWKLTASTYFPQ